MDAMEVKQGRCILMCAGEFTPIEIAVEEGDLCIAVDGGFEYFQMLGILPHLIVGDFDSTSEDNLEQIAEIEAVDSERVIHLKPEKDDTDTLFAVKEGLRRGYRKFYFYGALGGRLDHSFANIQTLLYLKKQNATGYILTHKELITVIRNEDISFHKGMTGKLSLFAMGEKAQGVTIRGMKYELEDAVITNDFPIGISNEFLAQREGYVQVLDGELAVFVQWED